MNTTVIIVTLVGYKLLLLAIGFWANGRTSNTEDFFLGGRGLGPVVAAISYSASSASAWTLLGMSGVAYLHGLSTLWMAAGAVIGAAVAWLWIAPRLMRYSREKQQITLTDFLTQDAGPRTKKHIRIFASLIILFSFVFYISSQFQGAGNTFASTFDMNMASSITLGGIIIVTYTLLGGFWAVSVTDTIQGILMLATALLLPTAAWITVGGWSGLITQIQQAELQEVLTLTAGHVGIAAAGFIVGGLAVGIGTYGQPHLLNRFMALRDERALKQAQIIAISWFALVFFGMVLLGLAGRVLIPELDNPETIFFRLTTELFPPLMGAILLAAVLSAIMSTADSMLLVASACVSHDLQLERRFPGKELTISRITMAVISALAIALAIFLPASIFGRVLFAWIAIGSAFGPILFVRLAGVPVTDTGVFRAMVCGFGLAVLLYWLPNTPGDIAERLLPFISGIVILLAHRKKPQTQVQNLPLHQ
jgi:sodium/proline symporter